MTIARACAVAVALGATSTAFAAPIPVVNNNTADRPTLLTGLQPLDLSTQVYGAQMSGAFSNEFETTYTGTGGNYSGTLKLEVFGNVGTPGASLNDVVFVYTFVGDQAFNGAEGFHFGINSQFELDVTDLAAATQGTIDAETDSGAPEVTIFDNDGANDTWNFDYLADNLGGPTDEVVTWYVRTDGAVKLNFVDVTITNFGSITVDMLAPVIDSDQPDLNVPAPGAIALLAGAGLVGVRRRR